MKTSIITLKTITIGMKAKKTLSAHGIKSRLIKIDTNQSQNGCQYGIEIKATDFYDAVRILRENEIEYGVYKPK